MARRVGYKTVLYVDPAGGTDFDEIGSLVGGTSNGITVDNGDVTCAFDKCKQFQPTRIDQGERTFQVYLDQVDPINQTLWGMLEDGSIGSWKTAWSNGGYRVQKGFITNIEETVEVDELMVLDITVKITGDDGLVPSSGPVPSVPVPGA